MNYLLIKAIFFIAIALFAVNASAAPTNCPTSGSFATLRATNAAGGCYVEDQLFSNFTYLSTASGSGVSRVTASNFRYTTVEEGPEHIGFQFEFTLTALPSTSGNISIGWQVQGENILSSHLLMNATATGNSVAIAQTTYCLGGPVAGCPSGSIGQIDAYTGIVGTDLADSDFFSPVQSLGVSTNLSVFSSGSGVATITGLRQTIDPPTVPEPATFVLTGGTLVGVCFLRRRRS